ncbi:hypothetical protein STA3757_30770 [Stanieria sp. NIES-3757]|nr:hypothetical protein STA3757_30770 [Stanieria sp. NIES-3757]
MRKFQTCCKVAALLTGLILNSPIATFAETPTSKEQNPSIIIAQRDEVINNPAIDEKADKILRQLMLL